ncbi:MAG: hypothetical protein JXQ83_12795 [Candidatus Glassbacteria bacterium]|nr:hypothetical protein [Candidatus Glassbacteria bacterium]
MSERGAVTPPGFDGRPGVSGPPGAGDEQREFLDDLIASSGIINRLIMRFYRSIDIRGLERWYAHIQRLNHRRLWRKRLNLLSYWPLRVLERVSAVYIGGSLTASEQYTFGRICKIRDYELSRYNAVFFGSLAGVTYFCSGRFTSWLGSFGTVFDMPLDLTTLFLYGIGAASVVVDLFRAVDSFIRRRAHMPLGFFPLAINSTTFLKRLLERSRSAGRSSM